MISPLIQFLFLTIVLLFQSGCATLFGWDIHAPGVLSKQYYQTSIPADERVALYLPDSLMIYQSKDRGGRFADPQTYHIGESLAPMAVEAFQRAFEEFILMEAEPTADIMKQYAIPQVAVLSVKDFRNRVTLKGQTVTLVTEVAVYDSNLDLIARYEAKGSSDAQSVFAKKGGPEVNLNAAIENNLSIITHYLQDLLRQRAQPGAAI